MKTKTQQKNMLSLFYIILTFISLFLIPALFISWRLSVPFSLINILRFLKIITFKYDDEEERNHKGGAMKKKLRRDRMPKHVAIILDGNRRWAKKRGLRTSEGHEAGAGRLMKNAREFFAMGTSQGHEASVNKLREKAKEYFVTGTSSEGHKPEASKLMESAMGCFDMGTTIISIFAFSTENWQRPEDEVNSLMALFENNLKSEMPYFQRDKIKISVIGNRARIPESLLGIIREAEETTKSYEGKHLIIAIDYSGKFDILQACKSLAKKARDGLIEVDDINEEAIEKELMTKCCEFPNPDLMIRTSGEQRISNFFLWQFAYTELYFTPVLWPDFGEPEFLEALTWYQQRQRRFGRRV